MRTFSWGAVVRKCEAAFSRGRAISIRAEVKSYLKGWYRPLHVGANCIDEKLF